MANTVANSKGFKGHLHHKSTLLRYIVIRIPLEMLPPD
jgi:hypothetical protein